MNPFHVFGGGLFVVSALFVMTMAEDSAEKTVQVSIRVALPADYLATFKVIRVANKPGAKKVGTIYANEKAAAVTETGELPYANGSIIVMEWSEPLKDASGAVIVDAEGNWKRGEVMRVDVMQREDGFGVDYAEKRAGDWEFASYHPDGTFMSPPQTWNSCAECHQKAATRDFVFRGRFPALETK